MSGSPWRKSSFSSGIGNQDCVEVAALEPGILYLRESEDPKTVLALTPTALRSLFAMACCGRLDADRRSPRHP
ncbi:DUF397 domain-containing protein [Streptomyces sp. NPDC021100]|uniref:DUF397 domain-containing protein n=1 Tax=Streptomyces sp. NPDC021100 TaxID=3365114 RepID=UPI0037A15F7C